jgi:hypothetical protein
MNGNGIVPTVDLGNNSNNGGWGGNMGEWILGIIALGMLGNGGMFGGFGGANGEMAFMYPWIANGQQEIMTNTNNGFDTLHLSNQVEGVRDGIYSLSNQLCNCCSDMQQTVSNGFYNSEIAAANRQMANMNQNFSNQIATLQGFNGIQKSLDSCCYENRLATANLGADIAREACATRFSDANNTRDIIDSANRNSQAILDKLCQLELDGVKAQLEAKNDLIAQLRQENLYARGQASQVAQTAEIRAGQATTANLLVNELRSCPIPSQPVYGNQPIFTCNGNGGCGCGNGYGNLVY